MVLKYIPLPEGVVALNPFSLNPDGYEPINQPAFE